jgi:mono/diheme cytochrome c family protein
MLKTLPIVFGLLLLVLWGAAQEAPKPPDVKPADVKPAISVIPIDAAQKANPVKPTSESLARGRRQFGFDCAMCHGKNGDGSGDVAADLKLKMKNQTDPATLKDMTDGELFYIIKKGKNEMPPEGDRVKNDEIWDMVNYVRSFAKKGGAAEEKAPN